MPSRRSRYCRACAAAYARAHRPAYADLSPEAKQRARCRAFANTYKRRGLIPVGPCEHVGSECRGPMEMVHEDYTKPLQVRWFCRHHRRAAATANTAKPSSASAASGST